MNRRDVFELADRCGLVVDTYGPGDGITRYRFGARQPAGSFFGNDYFSMKPEYTALGLKESRAWLLGYAAGRESIPGRNA